MGIRLSASRNILAKAVFLVLSTMLCTGSVAAQDSQKSTKVLILFTHQSDQPGQVIIEQAMRSTLQSGRSVPIEIYSEYLDAVRAPLDGHEKELVGQMQRKYAAKNFDLIFAVNPPALKLLVENRSSFFPDTPIVFLVLNEQNVSGLDGGTNMTGVWGEVNDTSNVELALALHPGTKQVVVISGVGEWDNYWRSLVQEELREFEGRIEVSYLTGLTVSELKKALAALPPQSLALFVSSSQDREGNSPGNLVVLREICPASSVPVYGSTDAQLGLGIVGGRLLSFEALGIEGAQVGLRVIAGEKPEAIAPHGIPSVPMFDWRQLQRWGINDASLPEGSIIHYKQPTVWEEYKWYIAGAITVSIFQTFLIGWLLFAQNRRRAAEKQRNEREVRLTETLDQLQLSAAAGNVGMWTRKIGADDIWVSEKAGEIWGFPIGEQFSREDFIKNIHPADHELFLANIRELEEGKNEFHLEYRVLSTDGNVRWIHSRGRVETVDGDRFIRGAIVDITKLKTAEEAIHDLSSKLMNAQEKERARLARELHDDLSQSIALLSIQLGTLRNEPKDIQYVKGQLDQFVDGVEQLALDVHRISHELHPARLTQLGLETALHGLCHELSAAHSLEIEFEAERLPRELPQEISLCLYRVTQESLQNVIKHSGAAAARVSVKLLDGEVFLAVSDNGDGFDPAAAKSKEALGLISIDERVRAVDGEAKVISTVGTGTRIEVRVPVTEQSIEIHAK